MLYDKKHIHILYASRLVEEKGVDVLIGLIEKISQGQYASYISWTICGDGIYQKKILELSQKYSNVEYLGRIGATELKQQYEKADFLFMPSRFLETFGLTALESLMYDTPVIGIRKGGLIPFIAEDLMIDESDAVSSSSRILEGLIEGTISPKDIDVSEYSLDAWKNRAKTLFPDTKKMLIVHDYKELIGGAENYIAFLEKILPDIGIEIRVLSYTGNTILWKRKWLFFLSIIAFWRGQNVKNILQEFQPDIIWMHSVSRYHGPWTIRQIGIYCNEANKRCFLSHHDLGMISPFPSDIYDESDIPYDSSLFSFLPREMSYLRILLSGCKWVYILLMKSFLTKKIEHIIFASFLKKHIISHFHSDKIHILQHTTMDL